MSHKGWCKHVNYATLGFRGRCVVIFTFLGAFAKRAKHKLFSLTRWFKCWAKLEHKYFCLIFKQELLVFFVCVPFIFKFSGSFFVCLFVCFFFFLFFFCFFCLCHFQNFWIFSSGSLGNSSILIFWSSGNVHNWRWGPAARDPACILTLTTHIDKWLTCTSPYSLSSPSLELQNNVKSHNRQGSEFENNNKQTKTASYHKQTCKTYHNIIILQYYYVYISPQCLDCVKLPLNFLNTRYNCLISQLNLFIRRLQNL